MADVTPVAGRGLQRQHAIVALGALVLASAVVRGILAWQHVVPRLFPDEYIYTALGRSIAHGQLAIRGGTVWFPGIFEPILAAPIWGLANPTLAYHLVQVENAVIASLAAIPVYALARKLQLSQGVALAAAVFA